MEGRILFDRGRVKLAPPTSTLLLTILFIFLFSPLFPLSAQENDNEVNVKKAPVNQNGIMETPLEEAKAFVADEVKADGSAPERIIKLSKLFKPFGDLKFRPFRDYEVVKNQIDIARHPRRDPIIPRDKILDWKFWGIDKFENRPKFVDIWFDPESYVGANPSDDVIWEKDRDKDKPDDPNNTIFGDPKSVFGCTVKLETPTEIRVSGVFADAQKAAQFPLRCEGNYASPSGKIGGEPIELHWAAKVASGIDLDIDNDNTNGTYGGPDRDLVKEDRWESDETKPGKFIPVNDGDADNDQIPGFADFDETSVTDKDKKNHFVPAVLDISTVPDKDIINWNNAKIRFTYSASNPKDEPLDNAPIKKYYMPEDGMIRIWTKDAWEKRNPKSVDGDGKNKGDFIPGKKVQPQGGSGGEDEGYEFLANKLFDSTGEMKKTLYIEGIGKGTTSGLIKVEFSPKGDNTWMPDEVKVTTLKLVLTKTPEDWMPKGGKQENSQSYTAEIIPKGIKCKIKFTLQHVTNYTGYCSNAANSGDSKAPDLNFRNNSLYEIVSAGEEQTATLRQEKNTAKINVACKDYGAYGELKAETITVSGCNVKLVANDIQEDGDTYDYVTIPRDEDGDKMADNWEAKQICFELFAPPYFGLDIDNLPSIVEIAKKLTQDFDNDFALGSTVANNHKDRFGDGITAFDEYRGFMVLSRQRVGSHVRTNPLVKDLFIYNKPYFYPKYGAKDKIPVLPSVYEDLGYNLYFVDNGKFGADRKIAFNGRSSHGKSSPQKCIRIIGEYETHTSGTNSQEIWALNEPGENATPMNSGEITVYFFKLFDYKDSFATKIFKTNVVDHEVGHSCYLKHHNNADKQRISCLMNYDKGPLFYQTEIQTFDDEFCKELTRIIVK